MVLKFQEPIKNLISIHLNNIFFEFYIDAHIFVNFEIFPFFKVAEDVSRQHIFESSARFFILFI